MSIVFGISAACLGNRPAQADIPFRSAFTCLYLFSVFWNKVCYWSSLETILSLRLKLYLHFNFILNQRKPVILTFFPSLYLACPSITGLNSPMVLFSPDVKEEEESSYFFAFFFTHQYSSLMFSQSLRKWKCERPFFTYLCHLFHWARGTELWLTFELFVFNILLSTCHGSILFHKTNKKLLHSNILALLHTSSPLFSG